MDTEIHSEGLKSHDQGSVELPSPTDDDGQDQNRQAGHESSLLSTGGSGKTDISTDETLVFDVPDARSGLPVSVSITGGVSDVSRSLTGMHVDACVALPHFPDFEETGFSTPDNRYFHKQGAFKRLGEGAYAVVETVYSYDPGSGELELCVCKSLKVDTSATHSESMLEWLTDASREVEALRRVAGVPGVVLFRDMITESTGAIHIIMEKVDGMRLDSRMNFRDLPFGGLTWLQVRLAVKHLGQVLAECHKRGVVHGDVKPENIMSLRDKNGIMLIDFGSASLCEGGGWEYEGGTMTYTAPEVIAAARTKPAGDAPRCFVKYGPPVDCWAYGVTAFKFLTCHSLFRPAEDGRPPAAASGIDDGAQDVWLVRAVADLHADWEDPWESRLVHVTFRDAMQQLAGASEEFKREGVDFLRGLLQPDPAKRLSAEQALHHPFLTKAFDTVDAASMPPDVDARIIFDMTIDPEILEMCRKVSQKSKEGI